MKRDPYSKDATRARRLAREPGDTPDLVREAAWAGRTITRLVARCRRYARTVATYERLCMEYEARALHAESEACRLNNLLNRQRGGTPDPTSGTAPGEDPSGGGRL